MGRIVDADSAFAAIRDMPNTSDGVALAKAWIMAALRSPQIIPTVDAIPVIHCKDCQKCTLWNDGHSFTCNEDEMDYYAPHYDAATYYCADGIRREE